jgi:hypothetical protein
VNKFMRRFLPTAKKFTRLFLLLENKFIEFLVKGCLLMIPHPCEIACLREIC